MPLPNLLVIGAMKSGTTSFHDLLNQHEEVQMSKVKEINFFSDDELWNKGIEWYKEQFEPGRNTKIIGESSVNYSKKHTFTNVPQRIKSALGKDFKLIYVIRNPLERFRSNFTDGKTYGDIPPEMNINEFILQKPLKENPYALTGLYHAQLAHYLPYASKSQIFIIEFERLISNTPQILKQVAEFLGLSTMNFNLIASNASSNKQYDSAIAIKLKKIKRLVPPSLKSKLIENGFIRSILKNKVKNSGNLLDLASRESLIHFYKEDIKALEKQWDFKPMYWNLSE